MTRGEANDAARKCFAALSSMAKVRSGPPLPPAPVVHLVSQSRSTAAVDIPLGWMNTGRPNYIIRGHGVDDLLRVGVAFHVLQAG